RLTVCSGLVPALALALAPLGVTGGPLIAMSGQRLQLREEPVVLAGEVEARLALHSLLQLGRYVVEQARVGVDRHQVVADVALATANRAEPRRRHPLRLRREVEAVPGVGI